MRTDSLHLSDDAKKQAKNVIEKDFGKEYHTSRDFKTKSQGAQEAHEAIRPTDLSRHPDTLKGVIDASQHRLYTLIWKRTLASQMSNAVVEVTTYTFSPSRSSNQSWVSKGEVIKFDGFMKLYIEGTDDELEEEADGVLPKVEIGEALQSTLLSAVQNFSRPPARYTEASLVKKLE